MKDIEHKKELEGIAPKLSQLRVDDPFAAPANYFDATLPRAMETISAMENIVNRINNPTGSTASPLAAPPDYFDQMQSDVLERIEKHSEKIVQWKSVFQIAAAVAALFLFSWPFFSVEETTKQTVTVQQLSEEDIFEYLNDATYNWTAYEIGSQLPAATLDTLVSEHYSTTYQLTADEALLLATQL